MVTINEIFPNPIGNDIQGEWLEIFNNGQSSINLFGWFLKTTDSKKFTFKNYEIQPAEYLVLPRKTTGLTLRNQDGKAFLYDKNGQLVDKVEFMSAAPEGKSFSRINSGRLAWAIPTPGKVNRVDETAALIDNNYPLGANLSRSFTKSDFILAVFGIAVILAATVVFLTKANENLSKLFFGKN